MMHVKRGIVPFLLVFSVALGACNDTTAAAADTCADFQGTWNTESVTYQASADPITAKDLTAVASITLEVDANCNYVGTADIQDVTSGSATINGSFTLDATLKNLEVLDATDFGTAFFNATYHYTLSGNTLTLKDPTREYDFDGAGQNPALPATLYITFVRQ